MLIRTSVFRLAVALWALLFIGSAQARVEDGALLIVDQPQLLREIEGAGFSAAELVEAEGEKQASNQAWSLAPGYGAIAKNLKEDLEELRAKDRQLSVTMAKSHRLFNHGWLTSPESRFELAGIINRIDRQPFAADRPGTCGEIRFIYRLAYRKKVNDQLIYSRLPMTLNVVYWAEGESCSNIAKRWLMQAEPKNAAALLNGPLQKKLFPVSLLKSVEVNLQAVRWPSTTRGDFGGYAEYLLRVYERQPGKKSLELAPMENTPDIAKINGSTSSKKKLLGLIRSPQFQKELDLGVTRLPDEFLARKAKSVAFHGQSRLANRPFDQIFQQSDFANPTINDAGNPATNDSTHDASSHSAAATSAANSSQTPARLTFTENQLIKSVAGVRRRLNEMSCVGCHQTRSIAGFHFIGIDPPETVSENAIKVSSSAHLIRDLSRRAQFVKRMAQGQSSFRHRPFADRSEQNEGEYGDHCSISNDPTFKSWMCQPGLVCRNDHAPDKDALLGVCMNEEVMAGDPCDVGVVTQNVNPHKDRVINRRALSCGSGRHCLKAWEGFPDGLCFGDCDGKPGEACGMIAVGGFNECLFRNEPFTDCLTKHTGPISMRACDEKTVCRDDFICAAGKDGKGSCIPPYFLFQLRLDGHPKP